MIRSCVSLLSQGQLSTDKLVLQFVHIFIVSFPGWVGINFNPFELIPAKTGNGATKMYTNCVMFVKRDSS